jgi:hypothetical protein
MNQEKDKYSKHQPKNDRDDEDSEYVKQADIELIHNIITQHQESLKLMQDEVT